MIATSGESNDTKQKNTSYRPGSEAFTLVELAITLVIVGLVVGGVLVGQDLIKSSENRATIAQAEKYNAAINTFRAKYNGLPGDIASYHAAAFGLFSETTLSGTAGHQDGNGLIEGGSSGSTAPVGETLSFWRHLSDANLVDGALGSSGNASLSITTGLVTANVTVPAQSLPATKYTPANYFIVYSSLGFNYFQILPITQIQAVPAYTYGTVGLTPLRAFIIDQKIDDGLPNTGIVQAKSITSVNGNPSFNASSASSNCLMTGAYSTDPTNTYNRVPATGGNDGSCSLRLRFN